MLAQIAKNLLDAGLGFFYPELCQLCSEARATAREGFVCARCASETIFIKPPFCERCGRPYEGAITNVFECANCRDATLHFQSARSAVLAKDKVLDAIHRFKYHRALWFEAFLGGLLVQEAGPALASQRWDALVPVPLHPTKQREREFNQAERLARHLGAAAGIPVKRLLRRTIPTRSQTLLSREERLTNVRDAFVVARSTVLEGQRFVLVDDVFTTGATTSACARALRGAGASHVCVWTVARGV
jgi:competence protein ComFC